MQRQIHSTCEHAGSISFRTTAWKMLEASPSCSWPFCRREKLTHENSDAPRFVKFPASPSPVDNAPFPFIFFFFSRYQYHQHSHKDEYADREKGTVLRQGFRFQNHWGEIGVSRYRLATPGDGLFSRVMRAGIHWSIWAPHVTRKKGIWKIVPGISRLCIMIPSEEIRVFLPFTIAYLIYCTHNWIYLNLFIKLYRIFSYVCIHNNINFVHNKWI